MMKTFAQKLEQPLRTAVNRMQHLTRVLKRLTIVVLCIAPCQRSYSQSATNVPPTIAGFDSPVEYVEDTSPVIIDGNATLSDSDSANFDGGVMIVELIRHRGQVDQLGIQNQFLGANKIAFDGENVRYNDVIIATIRRPGESEFRIFFNANATGASVQGVLRSLTYANATQNPNPLARELTVQVSDGDLGLNGGYSVKYRKQITCLAINDAPSLESFAGPVLYYSNGPAALVAPDVNFIDVDNFRINDGTVTVEIIKNAQPTDRITVPHTWVTSTGGTGATPLVIRVNKFPMHPATVGRVMRTIQFSSLSDHPSILPRTITVKVTDGDGGESILYRKNIFVIR